MRNKKNIIKSIKTCLIASSISVMCIYSTYAESVSNGIVRINFCTKWADRNAAYINNSQWYDIFVPISDLYDYLDEAYFDGLIVKYGVLGKGYENSQITLPSPTAGTFNCKIANLPISLSQNFYINLLFPEEVTSPEDDPQDLLVQIQPFQMKSCTVALEFRTPRNVSPDVSDEEIFDNRKIYTDCLPLSSQVVDTAICPKVEDLVYEPGGVDSNGFSEPNVIKGKGGNYTFKDKDSAFLFDPLRDRSDIVFAGSKISKDKNDIGEGVMHCYYKFLQHTQYGKLNLKEKFDLGTHEVRPIDSLFWAKSIDNYDLSTHSSWDITYTCPLITNTSLTQEECKTLILKKNPS